MSPLACGCTPWLACSGCWRAASTSQSPSTGCLTGSGRGGRAGTLLRLLKGWFVVSLPLGLFLGRFIAAGQRRQTLRPQNEDRVPRRSKPTKP
ncbi:hypothetical protein FV232_27240 [Methylobacterium sp. WL30]|nr:hypothetical protein FV232_27240 [Methylobacterium sp. WL30]